MRCCLGIFLAFVSANAASLIVDHVTAAGSNLKALQAHLAAAGIPSVYGGPHSNHATEMALTSFPDGSYLELIGLQPQGEASAIAAHYWSKQMKGDAGPTAWAVRGGESMAGEIARLKSAGVQVSAPARSGRTLPNGTKLDWEAAQVGPEPNGTFFPFLIRDFTPRPTRAFPQGHASTDDFSGIKRVVIAVRDLRAATARFQKAYGLPAPAEQEEAAWSARLASFSGTPVILAAAAGPQSWIAARIAQFGEGPCAFLLGRGLARQFSPQSKWFGADVSWFEAGKLGWHLGVER